MNGIRYPYEVFANCHAGETGIVIGNGPSLGAVPLEFLKSMPTLGCNRVTDLLPEFAPTYYTCIGWNQLFKPEQQVTIFPLFEHPDNRAVFINRLAAHFYRNPKVWSMMSGSGYGMAKEDYWRFSKDPLNIVGILGTQTYINLQLAYYFGFKTVVVVGLDGTYGGSSMHWYPEKPEFPSGPGIYKTDEAWRAACEKVYAEANRIFRMDGRRILNITPGSLVESLEKDDPGNWITQTGLTVEDVRNAHGGQ